MHIVRTIIFDTVVKGECNHKQLCSPDDVATFINEAFGIQALNGRQLREGVSNDRVGKPPLVRGRPSEIPSKEFELLAQMFFTLSKIEQANGSKRRSRTELTALLGDIINHKRQADGKEELDEDWVMKQIEIQNSMKQQMKKSTACESYRGLWLTYDNLMKNYMRWEECLVELGFAHLPIDDKEKKAKGHVVFFEGQMNRVLNVNELCLYLDGKAEHGSGRPGSTPICSDIPDAGTATNKSSMKVTIQFGIAGNEFIPPHVNVPSSAAAGQAKLFSKMFHGYREIIGKYGCLKEHHWQVLFSVNKSG